MAGGDLDGSGDATGFHAGGGDDGVAPKVGVGVAESIIPSCEEGVAGLWEDFT